MVSVSGSVTTSHSGTYSSPPSCVCVDLDLGLCPLPIPLPLPLLLYLSLATTSDLVNFLFLAGSSSSLLDLVSLLDASSKSALSALKDNDRQ